MSYLVSRDYNLLIQAAQLTAITSSDSSVQYKAELWAQEEIISKLTQRYDMTKEFSDTSVFNMTTAYKAKARVELNFSTYSAASLYALKALVIYAGSAYVCTTAITVAEAFTLAHWALIGAQYELFYVTLPYPEFDYQGFYKVGDQVWWKDKTYTCLVETNIPSHSTEIQYSSISRLPLINVFPDDAVNGVTNWGTGVAYAVAAETLPTDTTKWTAGDNRSQQIVNYMVAMALYRIHVRIAPGNIPKVRIDDYNQAISFLERVNHGIDNANLPEIQPLQGSPITYGGQVKRNNQW
jgi:hypothetical protein